MYRTIITLEVLSENPIHPGLDAEDILVECNEGGFVLASDNRRATQISGKEMADALRATGSEPWCFCLDDEGNKTDV